MSKLRYNLDFFIAGLKNLGLNRVVISPGSRNAPIVAGFLRVGGFELLSAPDERAAAFMALGSAQAAGKACAVVCTSGTAALNLYPAICEAYYQQIPLIAITADRPEQMIDRWDGQTIRQNSIFEKHILGSFHLKSDIHQDVAQEEISELVLHSWQKAHGNSKGPIHINIPLPEPIYEGLDTPPFAFETLPAGDSAKESTSVLIPDKLTSNKNILVVAGQGLPNTHLKEALNTLGEKLPVLADVLSNVHGEHTLSGTEEKSLFTGKVAPDILITTGMSVVSKPLKEWLRKHKPEKHYHVSESEFVGDPFFTHPIPIFCNPTDFFNALNKAITKEQTALYKGAWVHKELPIDRETQFIFDILDMLEENDAVHLGNSMTVRQANHHKNLNGQFFGNRGTSGIDGSISTACGYAWSRPEQRVICISGDIGFLYDKNAFWCSPMPNNLKVIVMNNGMGRIFDKIDGPGKMPALRPFIQTPHNLTAEHIALHYGIQYNSWNVNGNEKSNIRAFLQTAVTGIMEIFT